MMLPLRLLMLLSLALVVLQYSFASADAISKRVEYRKIDGSSAFVFDNGEAGIGPTPAERKRLEARGIIVRDSYLYGRTSDCSGMMLRCVELENDNLVFAVDLESVLAARPYRVRGALFTPVCAGSLGKPRCGVASITFSSKTGRRGFFLFSALDGILAIGLQGHPDSEIEDVFVIVHGTQGLLAQAP